MHYYPGLSSSYMLVGDYVIFSHSPHESDDLNVGQISDRGEWEANGANYKCSHGVYRHF